MSDVYYVKGLNQRLLSLLSVSGSKDFSVSINNRSTTITFPDNTTYTWPLRRQDNVNAFTTSTTTQHTNAAPYNPLPSTKDPSTQTIDNSSQIHHEDKHEDDRNLLATNGDYDSITIMTPHARSTTYLNDPNPKKSLPLELLSRRLAYRNFRNLMAGSLHNVWRDHSLSPSTDSATWPIHVTINQKRARSKIPLRLGTPETSYLHIDLIKNPFRFGLTVDTNYSSYLSVGSVYIPKLQQVSPKHY